jgi:membrane fusion protein (multidrug efflux system)
MKEARAMADPALKVVPAAKEKGAREKSAGRRKLLPQDGRARLRFVLLVAIPLAAAAIGLAIYLMGGRYITTDNAYVGAQKVLITPDISGKIARVVVREGEHVKPGDVLFEIDPVPFRLALEQAQSRLAGVRTDFANLKTNEKALAGLIELARKNVDLKERDVERKQTLVTKSAGAQADVDNAQVALVAAQNQRAQLEQQRALILNQLKQNPDLPLEQYPPYIQAKAALDQAQRDLDHTVLRAPIAGTATQVDSIQLGRFVTAGTPVFALVDDNAPWVDANPKETDITHLRIGQRATIDVDTFPEHSFHGTVTAISPGTGAQFAILPPQNASGNWVKVVQRVPVRITFDPGQDTSRLRAGMSATVSIDTRRRRSFGALFGIASAHEE